MATRGENTGAAVPANATPAPAAESTATAQSEADKIIAAAKSEAEKIAAEATAQAAKVLEEAKAAAESTATAAAPQEKADDPGNELVPFYLFKDNDKYKDDVFVAVNGERVQIKRGETVMIKRKFATVLEQSLKQDTATANMMEEKSAEFAARAAAYNL